MFAVRRTMNVKVYNSARRYAEKLKFTDSQDLLHDAYLIWYDKKGVDMFDEPVWKVFTVIRLTFLAFLKAKKRRHTYFEEFVDGYHKANQITPEDEAIATDLKKEYLQLGRLTRQNAHNHSIINDILFRKAFGLRNDEIAEDLSVSKSLVTYYLKQVDTRSILN